MTTFRDIETRSKQSQTQSWNSALDFLASKWIGVSEPTNEGASYKWLKETWFGVTKSIAKGAIWVWELLGQAARILPWNQLEDPDSLLNLSRRARSQLENMDKRARSVGIDPNSLLSKWSEFATDLWTAIYAWWQLAKWIWLAWKWLWLTKTGLFTWAANIVEKNRLLKLAASTAKELPTWFAYEILTDGKYDMKDFYWNVWWSVVARWVGKGIKLTADKLGDGLMAMGLMSSGKFALMDDIISWMDDIDALFEGNKLKEWVTQLWVLSDDIATARKALWENKVTKWLFENKIKGSMATMADKALQVADDASWTLDEVFSLLDEINPTAFSNSVWTSNRKQLSQLLNKLSNKWTKVWGFNSLATEDQELYKELIGIASKKRIGFAETRRINQLANDIITSFTTKWDMLQDDIASTMFKLYHETKPMIEKTWAKLIKENADLFAQQYWDDFVRRADTVVRDLNKNIQLWHIASKAFKDRAASEMVSTFMMTILLTGGIFSITEGLISWDMMNAKKRALTFLAGTTLASWIRSASIRTPLANVLHNIWGKNKEILMAGLRWKLKDTPANRKLAEQAITSLKKSMDKVAKEWKLLLPLVWGLGGLMARDVVAPAEEIWFEDTLMQQIQTLETKRGVAKWEVLGKIEEMIKRRKELLEKHKQDTLNMQ